MNITENDNLHLTRKQLAEFLLLSAETLKKIKEDQLNSKITKAGYKLIRKYKQGKTIYYELEKVRDITEWDIIQYTNRIRKTNEHDLYSSKRIKEGLKQTKTQIIKDNNIDISLPTAKKFDDILEYEGYIEQDKSIYMLYDSETKTYTEITENEYKHYWLRNRYARDQLSDIKMKKNKYIITEDDYDSLRDIIINDVGNKEGTIVMKFDTYIALEKSKDLIELINKTRLAKGEKEIV